MALMLAISAIMPMSQPITSMAPSPVDGGAIDDLSMVDP
jgi:hypothetical protein